MSKKLRSVSAFALTVLFLSLISVASVAAQRQQCSDIETMTGKGGWMLVSGPGISTPKVPVSVTPYPGWQNPALPNSNWISVDSSRGNLPGDYTYEVKFCLCKGGKHNLNLSFYADNGAKVFLNSTQIFATTGVYNFTGAAKVVNYNWAAGPGPNTLRIVVSNQGSVTGLDASLRVTGASARDCGRATDKADEPGHQPETKAAPGRTDPIKRPN